MHKAFLSVLDLEHDQLDACLRLAQRLKAERSLGRQAPTGQALAGGHVALLFEKPSLRTRSTFEIAVRELGGEILDPSRDAALGARESVADVARNLERWVSAVVIRTFAQRRLQEFSQAAPDLPLINALTDEEHPCQALADVMTLQEHLGALAGRRVAYVGDGNNVATSLVQACLMAGVSVGLASPAGSGLSPAILAAARAAARHGATAVQVEDPRAVLAGADAVYTDVWTSMGQETEGAARRERFVPYQVNPAMMALAAPGALFMHCLPAHRGDEVTDEVIDGPASVVFDQSENRLHTQKALLLMLVKNWCAPQKALPFNP